MVTMMMVVVVMMLTIKSPLQSVNAAVLAYLQPSALVHSQMIVGMHSTQKLMMMMMMMRFVLPVIFLASS